MSAGLIDPEAMPAPSVHLGDLEATARALKKDGRAVARAGCGADAAWQGLAEVYRAPESEILVRATRPVASHGRAVENELAVVGDALLAFVDEVRPIVARLHGLRATARDFRAKVDGDWDGDPGDWRDNGDWVEENNRLSNDALAALAQYQDAERACANKITSIFGGTRFVPLDAAFKRRGDQAYGWSEAPKDVKTPWGTPQEHDKPWYEDVRDGITGFGDVMGTFFGDLAGLHGQNGWYWRTGVGRWWDNIKGNYPRMLTDLGRLERSLTGQRGDFSDAWAELGHSIVPWREWADRPGYVVSQSLLNIGSLFTAAGGVKAVTKVKRGAGEINPVNVHLPRENALPSPHPEELKERILEKGLESVGWYQWRGGLEPTAADGWRLPEKTRWGYRDDLVRWVYGHGPEPGPTSTMNCWEAVMHNAYRANGVDKATLRQWHDEIAETVMNTYRATGDEVAARSAYFGKIGDFLAPGGRTQFTIDPVTHIGGPDIPAAHLIFFDHPTSEYLTANGHASAFGHVMISLGTRDALGRQEALSHFTFPERMPDTEGRTRKYFGFMQRTSVEEVVSRWKAHNALIEDPLIESAIPRWLIGG
ncbi:hypothetical protein E1293_26065 [Actinomadura darangshiensis]|uniref:Uncharacterized protein n=1 Tax=Actinomadura darangshiensis TaxID=705336 RepID=A0A4R5AXS1_9ACTN|nr:hypothetical protein [Actinomadura darangshiensis]TDD77663.1 hypothetical protein E1293_26065 [Actinomadura darangshiensis]